MLLATGLLGLGTASHTGTASAQSLSEEFGQLTQSWIGKLDRLVRQGKVSEPVRLYVPVAVDADLDMRCEPLSTTLKTELERALTERSGTGNTEISVIDDPIHDLSSFVAALSWRSGLHGTLEIELSVGRQGDEFSETVLLDKGSLPLNQLAKQQRDCLVSIDRQIDRVVEAFRPFILRDGPSGRKELTKVEAGQSFTVLGKLRNVEGVIAEVEVHDRDTGRRTVERGFVFVSDAELSRLLVTDPQPGSRAAGSDPAEGAEALTVFQDCESCPFLVVLPVGRFAMGSPEGETGRSADEGPIRNVTFDAPFAIGQTEVQFDEWQACVDRGGCPRRLPRDFGWGREDRPVIDVSFEEAETYAGWLSDYTGFRYRLPTEAEWEYAARAGRSSRYPWGDVMMVQRAVAVIGRWRPGRTQPVAQYKPNAFGLYDTVGNVWEWAADCWAPSLADIEADGSARPGEDCDHRAIRGGGFSDDPLHLRVANRNYAHTTTRAPTLGLRVVREITKPE